MPELMFRVRWPDGAEEVCYSPSSVVREHLAPGAAYPLGDFLHRSRTALSVASGRVAAKYGFHCSRALGQIQHIEAACARFADMPEATVLVQAFEE